METALVSSLGGYGFLAKVLRALIPLFGVLGGALASWLVAGRNVYINSITAERSKWLDKLRSSISDFQAAVSTYNFRKDFIERLQQEEPTSSTEISLKEFFEDLERITRLASTIQLQLNPNGAVDKNIIALVQQMSISRHGEGQLMVQAEHLLTKHSQWLLKAEWEKVKWEAGSILYKAWHWRDDEKRRSAYSKFSTGLGDITKVVSGLRASIRTEPAKELAT